MSETKEKSPAYQRYPKDYLTDLNVQVMTLSEEGAYNRLMDIWWNERGYLPNDDEQLVKAVGKDCTLEIIRVVKKCFKVDPNDETKLIHPRLQKEFVKQQKWSEKSAMGGRKSAEVRANRKRTSKKTDVKGGSFLEEPDGNSSSSFSSSISNKEKYIKEKEIFNEARKIYPGSKNGNDTEFNNFIKKHKDWKEVLPFLMPAIISQISKRAELSKIPNKFIPPWKNFQTWINKRSWEEEGGEFSNNTSPGVDPNKPIHKGSFFKNKNIE